MKNPLKTLLSEDYKKYRKIIESLNTANFLDVLNLDTDYFISNGRFGIEDINLIEKIENRIREDLVTNPKFFQTMIDINYSRIHSYFDIVIKNNPYIIEKIISSRIYFNKDFISLALDSGYKPSSEFINNNPGYFNEIDILNRLVDDGYKPSNELLEKEFGSSFADPILMKKALIWGYVPTIEFLKRCIAFRDEKVLDELFGHYQITDEVLNNAFDANPTAQRKIIERNSELLLKLNNSSTSFAQFWIEAIKKDNIPEELIKNNWAITGDYLLMSKIIKKRPDFIKYCQLVASKERDQLDSLALAMGYLPTKNEVMNSPYIQKSYILMENAILQSPEVIKYIEPRPLEGAYSNNIDDKQFVDLARLAVENGYIPIPSDIDQNPRLADSFDIMKLVIAKQPNYLEKCRDRTQNVEKLCQIALENGYELPSTLPNFIGNCESIIKARVTQNGILTGAGSNNHSLELYNFLIENKYSVESIAHLFIENFEVMKLIVAQSPNKIATLETSWSVLSRKQIDELCIIAINNGYVPTENNKIFGHGLESAKIMIKRFPNFINDTDLLDGWLFNATPIPEYEELCSLALDSGYIPNAKNFAIGYSTKFNRSYSMMKVVLPKHPNAIDICLVEDQDKYNELCQLAIANGYEPTEYGITHYKKIKTNYEIMAIAVKKAPKLILDAELSKSNEVESLLQLAIENGLDIDSLRDNELMKLFLQITKDKWLLYLPPEKIELLEKSIKFYNSNVEISNTLNPKFLSEATISHFSKLQIEVLSCYSKLQEEIINLNYNPRDLKTIIVYELVSEFKDDMEWIIVLENVIKNINSKEFASLFSDLKDREVSYEDRKKILYLLNYGNHLDISNYSELQSIDTIREEYINMLIKRDTVGSLKSAYLEKVYGIDLPTAINFVKLYGESLNGQSLDDISNEDKHLFEILSNMKKIINTNNTEILKNYLSSVKTIKVSYDLMVVFENRLKKVYTDAFNKSFTKPKAEDKAITNIPDEEKFEIFYAAGKDGKKKTRLMITSIGAYTGMTEPDDYYASWNVAKIASHSCCCSYVGEKNLGTAEVKYCCLGFTDYEQGTLQLSAPYDLCSASVPDQYTVSATYSSMYLMPDDILDYTRHTHNETVWERRKITAGESLSKKQPSYIVYFVDNFEDRLTDDEAKRQWESVKKAAENFASNGIPLPIMVIEREKIAINQVENIEAMLNQYRQTLNSSLINQIINDYESNYAGNRGFHPKISEKYFPQYTKLADSVVGKIIAIIEELSITNPKEAITHLIELEKVIIKEKEKYVNTHHGIGQSLPSFDIEQTLEKITLIKYNLKKEKSSTILMINDMAENDRQYQKNDAPYMSEELAENQLSNEEVKTILTKKGMAATVAKLENEIDTEKVNLGLKVHGQRHVKNVTLFSGLIGQQVLANEDLKLVLIAAKYHDVGRTTEGSQEHAKASAQIAESRLNQICTPKEIAIIKTIIEFHEINRNSTYDYFKDFALKNGISEEELPRVRQMAEVLKDADALDRTRFINNARLKPELLAFPVSKQLVKFCSGLHETFAIEDLKDYNCEEQIAILLKVYTPQEILRIIRRSTTSEMTIDDIVIFINSWSQMEVQKLGDNYGR